MEHQPVRISQDPWHVVHFWRYEEILNQLKSLNVNHVTSMKRYTSIMNNHDDCHYVTRQDMRVLTNTPAKDRCFFFFFARKMGRPNETDLDKNGRGV